MQFTKFVLRALAVLIVGLVLSLAIMPLFLRLIEWSYELSGRKFDALDATTLPYIYTAVFGVVVTLLTVVATVGSTQAENRRQATIKILLDARLSDYFQECLDRMEMHFPKGKKASLRKFNNFKKSRKNEEKKAAEAVRRVLNYYEFISAGIMKGNLDETLLKETVRAILCGLVNDMRTIIRDFRVGQNQEKNYENLVAVYWRWVDESVDEEFGEEIRKDRSYLGS